MANPMNLERLPDEVLLNVYRYLSSADVLYSWFNLNARLTRTILLYRRHVILRLTSFLQFEYLCSSVLPQIGCTIRSLSINANWTDLIAKRFYFYFGHRMSETFPNIEHLILVAFDGHELNDYIASISDLSYLKKLTIRDRYHITDEYKQSLFATVLSANQFRLESVSFNRHSESLAVPLTIDEVSYSNVLELDIHLEKIEDLQNLLKLIPNIRRLNTVIDKPSEEKSVQCQPLIMKNLIEFGMESFRRCWTFDEFETLLKQMPYLCELSVDLFTQDFRLADGQQMLSILPKDSLRRFNYSTEYEPEEPIDSAEVITSSWASTPYPICCLFAENKTQIFLHTLPYGFSYLDVNSLFAKYMNKKTGGYQLHIQELLLFNVTSFAEVMVAIDSCRDIKDLALELANTDPLTRNEKEEKKPPVSLSPLKKLRWLSIDGCPSDSHLLKEIVLVAPQLCMLIVDITFLLRLFEQEENGDCLVLLTTRIRQLSIQASDESDFTEAFMEKVSSIFVHLRHLIIESKLPDSLHVENILSLLLGHFRSHPLISVIVRGKTSEQLRADPSQWLIDHTHLHDCLGKFTAECDEIDFKLWF